MEKSKVDLFGSLIKPLVKSVYSRSPVFQSAMFLIRRPGCRRMARAQGLPFNGDKYLIDLTEFLIQCGVTTFVETGTYLGHTCRYIAYRHPELSVITVESNPNYFDASKTVLKSYSNVRVIKGDSAKEIERFVKYNRLGLTLFFLDAHWYDFLPLPDEIRKISTYKSKAILIIHDFQVPGRSDLGFDTYKGQVIGIEMLYQSLIKGRTYHVFLPNYTYIQAYANPVSAGKELRGYAIVFIDAPEALDEFAKSEYGRWFTLYKNE
jgi:predicted O-methyltransferase YrrM